MHYQAKIYRILLPGVLEINYISVIKKLKAY